MKFLVIRKPRVGGALVATSKAIRKLETSAMSCIASFRR